MRGGCCQKRFRNQAASLSFRFSCCGPFHSFSLGLLTTIFYVRDTERCWPEVSTFGLAEMSVMRSQLSAGEIRD
jgi:hypothetical protein